MWRRPWNDRRLQLSGRNKRGPRSSLKRLSLRSFPMRIQYDASALSPRVVLAVTIAALSAGMLPAQSVRTIHSFNGTDGEFPQTMVVTQGRDGRLYGTTQ